MSYNLIHCNCGRTYAEADGHNCKNVSDAYRIEELEAKLAAAELVARYETDVAQQAIDQMKAEKARADALMRCAECDCEKGGADCNWIATPTLLNDPRVEALMDLIKRAEHNVPKYYTLWHSDARAALEAIASPSIATPLNDPRVKALVEALKEAERMLKHYGSRDAGGMAQIRAALSALEENK